MHSDTGSIAAELLGKDMLSISLAGIDEDGVVAADSDVELNELDEERVTVLEDNVVDAAKRFKKKDDNDGNK